MKFKCAWSSASPSPRVGRESKSWTRVTYLQLSRSIYNMIESDITLSFKEHIIAMKHNQTLQRNVTNSTAETHFYA